MLYIIQRLRNGLTLFYKLVKQYVAVVELVVVAVVVVLVSHHLHVKGVTCHSLIVQHENPNPFLQL